MAFGIDVSKNQDPAGFDYLDARAEGVEFVIVKAAGFNTGELYVADLYHEHVHGARTAGLAIGHYYLVGRGDPIVQADFFVDHLHAFDPDRDVLALDNEKKDANPVFWQQDDAFDFLARVQGSTGVPWERLWLYCPASETRDHQPWGRITDRGIRVWWAAYGDRPTGHRPDHRPDIDGVIDRWDIHQFTDRSRIAGLTVDADISPIPVGELFGGHTQEAEVARYRRFMTDTPFQVRSNFQRFPYRTNPREENLAADTGGFGLYSLIVNLYLEDFPADAQIEGRLVLEFADGGTSPGYLFTVDGSATGKVEVAVPANIRIEKPASLFLELRKSAGDDDPTLTTWGVDVTNLAVAG